VAAKRRISSYIFSFFSRTEFISRLSIFTREIYHHHKLKQRRLFQSKKRNYSQRDTFKVVSFCLI